MQVILQTRGFPITLSLREFVTRRAAYSLGWADHQVAKITIRLSDINGPRGGDDKQCRIQVSIPRGVDVVISDVEPDLYTAISRATDRAARTLARQIERRREQRGTKEFRLQPETEMH